MNAFAASMSGRPYTPGPWRVLAWECHAATTVVADVDGQQIVVAECSGHGRYADESLDDARLIAAAPELLEALQSIMKAIESRNYFAAETHAQNIARAAIAKATGAAPP